MMAMAKAGVIGCSVRCGLNLTCQSLVSAIFFFLDQPLHEDVFAIESTPALPRDITLEAMLTPTAVSPVNRQHLARKSFDRHMLILIRRNRHRSDRFLCPAEGGPLRNSNPARPIFLAPGTGLVRLRQLITRISIYPSHRLITCSGVYPVCCCARRTAAPSCKTDWHRVWIMPTW